MAYNYPPPGAYGARPPFGAPPGMAQPPSYGAAPGMEAPPGMSQSPAGMPAPFQMPPNLPNINLNAPVIRLGLDGQRPGGYSGDRAGGGRGRDASSNAEPMGNRNRAGLGADPGQQRNLDRERAQLRENMLALQPPTREEVARTVFVGGLGEGVPRDDQLEAILRCAGRLRRWTRAKDADDKRCKFGFAEYEDAESLEAASEIYQDLEVPLFDQIAGLPLKEEGENGEVKKTRLLVVVDEQSKKYVEEWVGRKKEDDTARQSRIDGAQENARQCIAAMLNTGAYAANAMNGQFNGRDADGDAIMAQTNGDTNGDGTEVVNIPLSLEDELADIPAEMRQTVAEEIRAFRDRSTRRDMERLKREEEMEQAERQRSGIARVGRLASPPPSGAPLGPASASNGIPVGPRGTQGIQGAPSGPRGFRGAQLPSDYVNGVNFVPGAGPGGLGVSISIIREEEDAEESDEELERRRNAKEDAELDRKYDENYRRWINRERTRGAAQDREKIREATVEQDRKSEGEKLSARLASFNEDDAATRARDEYYYDHSAWVRHRAIDRDNEMRQDDRDRQMEDREKADERRREAEARGQADNFLDSLGRGGEVPVDSTQQQQQPAGFGGFKISLGGAAKKTQHAAEAPTPISRKMADVEGLLEEEEDAAEAGVKRPELKPLTDTSAVPLDLTDEERATMRSQLAAEIPTDTARLFAYPIKWDKISATLLDGDVKSFVERKVVEYLGVQEDLLVDTVVEGLKKQRAAKDLISELEPALEDESEVLMKKVWRMLVFFSESASRGLT